jgi:ectoine hydroxylase-related dioxygenase (phytanoyl-CoA dioxygenase family)
MDSIPFDEDDSRFAKSFDCTDSDSTAAAVSFFNEFGFVVLRSVFDEAECAQTRDAMWSILESSNPEFNHNDQKTWSTMKSKGNYGLSIRGPSFHPTLVNNR